MLNKLTCLFKKIIINNGVTYDIVIICIVFWWVGTYYNIIRFGITGDMMKLFCARAVIDTRCFMRIICDQTQDDLIRLLT